MATSQKARLAAYLEAGNTVTQGTARARFGISNLRAVISDLRTEGLCIYTNFSRKVAKYRLGAPNRAMVSIAYRVAGSRPFGAKKA